MKEEIISLETAILAKEKGFNWECRGRIHCSHHHFAEKGDTFPSNNNEMFAPIKDWNNIGTRKVSKNVYESDGYTSLPTQSLLQKWLRKVHNIHISIDYGELSNKYMGQVNSVNNRFVIELECIYKTYELALEEGLKESLKLIKL